MPSTRDLLQRFRPAGAPGAATAAGVPADRQEERDAELAPVFMLLEDSVAEAARIRSHAVTEAERRRQHGRSTAAARVAAARLEADAIRADLLARAQQDVRSTRAQRVAAAYAIAATVQERGRQSLDADVAEVVTRVRATLAAATEKVWP